MKQIWHDHYPAGVSHDIDVTQYKSLAHLFDESFKKNANRRFSVCMDEWMSYGQLDTLSTACGAWLQGQGIAQGERVALMMPNLPQFPVCMAGILRAGYTCVNVNPLYTARELKHQLKDSGATTIIILENFAHTLADVIEDTQIERVVIASFGDLLGFWFGRWMTFAVRHLAKMVPAFKIGLQSAAGKPRSVTTFKAMISAGSGLPFKAAQADLDTIAFLQYTGGTTGLSKGAVLTHGNVIAAILQGDQWFTPGLKAKGINASDANGIAALPLYHIFALTLCLVAMRWGSQLTLIPNPRDIPKFVGELRKRPFHFLPAVNTLFNALLQNAQFKNLDFSHLCISQAGGMAASSGTAKHWYEVTGCPMVEGWGMSETCAIGTNNPVTATTFSGTIGLPFSGIEIAIKSEAGESLPVGQSGEICIKGPNVMRGYYNQPEETAKAFTADGFMRTGDVGVMDERGYTKIVDRIKDMIIVSGFNVFPSELEDTISLADGIVECAVVGVPDERSGEAIKVFAVKENAMMTEDDLMKYCRQNFTGYKIPKYIEFRDELPKSNVGKILRRELRAGK